jgi:hypothetical protein
MDAVRDYEFRGKKLGTGEWLYGNLFNDGAEDYVVPRTLLGITGFEDYQVDQNTIGEWTLLRDKNDVKVYEGDIVEYHGFKYLVIRNTEIACFAFRSINVVSPDIIGLALDRKIRIIGNRNDNPELL